jgi:hypothetical protein
MNGDRVESGPVGPHVADAASRPGLVRVFLRVVGAIILCEALAAIAMLVVGALSSGYALSDELALGLFGGGALVGVIIGLWPRRAVPRPIAEAAESAAPAPVQGSCPIMLFVFVVGAGASAVLGFVVLMVASFARGPVIGTWELGTPRYQNDQRPIDLAAGAAVAVAGLLLGVVLRRQRARRPALGGFATGLIVGSVLLGAAIALRK